jgi:hypothetical protein
VLSHFFAGDSNLLNNYISGFHSPVIFQVDKVISTQLAMMKADQLATSGESASLSIKASGAGVTNLSHPGPSGLSGRSSKAGHGVPGKSEVHRPELLCSEEMCRKPDVKRILH